MKEKNYIVQTFFMKSHSQLPVSNKYRSKCSLKINKISKPTEDSTHE